jgi:hypothetical protein
MSTGTSTGICALVRLPVPGFRTGTNTTGSTVVKVLVQKCVRMIESPNSIRFQVNFIYLVPDTGYRIPVQVQVLVPCTGTVNGRMYFVPTVHVNCV